MFLYICEGSETISVCKVIINFTQYDIENITF